MDRQLQILINSGEIEATLRGVNVRLSPSQFFQFENVKTIGLQLFPNYIMLSVDTGNGLESVRLKEETYPELMAKLSTLAQLKTYPKDEKMREFVDGLLSEV